MTRTEATQKRIPPHTIVRYTKDGASEPHIIRRYRKDGTKIVRPDWLMERACKIGRGERIV